MRQLGNFDGDDVAGRVEEELGLNQLLVVTFTGFGQGAVVAEFLVRNCRDERDRMGFRLGGQRTLQSADGLLPGGLVVVGLLGWRGLLCDARRTEPAI